MRRRTLGGVLLSAIGGVGIGAVLVTAGLTLGLVRLSAERSAYAELQRDAGRVVQRLRATAAARLMIQSCRALPALGVAEVCFVPPGGEAPIASALPQGRAVLEGEDVLFVSRPANIRGRLGTLYVFRPAEGVGSLPRAIAGRIVVAAAAALVLASLVALVIARRIARPLGELAHAARGIAHGTPAAIGPAPGEPFEVTELREALVDLSRDLANARERERSFLMSVSHELRTPLTAIRGYGEALADGTAQRDVRRAGDVIVGESRRLERLVQDLLDLSRIQSGEFSVSKEQCDPADVARAVAESLGPRAREAGVRLVVEDDEPAVAWTDPDRAHQMLANLVENALRVTPSGGRVTIGVRGTAVDVTDTGPGIAPEDLGRAFDRFYLWGRYRSERAVGTGLGLAIVGELARLLEVKVSVTSQPGTGTRFALAFPAAS